MTRMEINLQTKSFTFQLHSFSMTDWCIAWITADAATIPLHTTLSHKEQKKLEHIHFKQDLSPAREKVLKPFLWLKTMVSDLKAQILIPAGHFWLQTALMRVEDKALMNPMSPHHLQKAGIQSCGHHTGPLPLHGSVNKVCPQTLWTEIITLLHSWYIWNCKNGSILLQDTKYVCSIYCNFVWMVAHCLAF